MDWRSDGDWLEVGLRLVRGYWRLVGDCLEVSWSLVGAWSEVA